MLQPCLKCGKIHTDWPAIGFQTPANYYGLSDDDKERHVKELTDDFCVIEYEDQTDYFIRAVLFQQITDHCEELHYGVWVSLSEKSFNDYNEHYKEDHEATYFGYLCNQLPEYDQTTGIRTNVVLKSGGERPEIFPHTDQMENAFVYDYYNGITKEEAERRIEAISK